MELTFIFSTVLLLVITRPSHQYVYSCNSSASCGCSTSPASVTRIVGGESAGTSTWGWAVSISIKSTSLCGGAVISSSWVITAAHCMSGVSASQVTIYAGSNTRFSGQSRVVSRITVHPSYNSDTHVNDIALLLLSTPLTMSDTAVKSVCIPYVSSAVLTAGEWPPADINVVAVGWGTLSESGSLPTVLQQVTLQTIPYSASFCSSVLYDRQTQLCAGVYGGGKDTCQGDSGGPLMMFSTSNQWVLIGLTSYGDGCARADYAGVYTRVATFQDWIGTTTGGTYTIVTSSNSTDTSTFPSANSTNTAYKTIHASPASHFPFLFLSLFLIIFYVS